MRLGEPVGDTVPDALAPSGLASPAPSPLVDGGAESSGSGDRANSASMHPVAPELAVVLVHYRTPDLLARALAALQDDARASGISAEWVIVDNGSTEAERAKLATLPARLIEPGANLGYAGGIGRGVAETRATFLLFANPDVLVQPGCVAALLQALRHGAAAAGPRFFWDRPDGYLLPPTERRELGDECWSRLGRLGEPFRRRAVGRWRRHACRHWTASEPLATATLSGALLAVSRSAWDRVGPMDAEYRLYFEECDWLTRARRVGLPTVLVPAATAIHLFGRSARLEPQVAAWFAESERRFRRLHFRRGARILLALLDRIPVPLGAGTVLPAPPTDLSGLVPAARAADARWIELSPLAAGFPAAARKVLAGDRLELGLTAEALGRLDPGVWRLAICDDQQREIAACRFVKEEQRSGPSDG